MQWHCCDSTGDHFPYYLVKLKKDPFLTDSNTKDDYGQTFAQWQKLLLVIIMSILNMLKWVTYIIENKQKQLWFSVSVLLVFTQIEGKKNCQKLKKRDEGNNEQMSLGLVTHELHQAFSEYTVHKCEDKMHSLLHVQRVYRSW